MVRIVATAKITGGPVKLPPTARAKRQAEGKAKTSAALERLDAAVANIVEHDSAFREYLRLSGRMHSYSWGNRLLIALQRPDAGMVGGFHRWKDLGRPVRKGAKGIQILAPMVIHEKVDASLAGYSTNAGTVGADGSLDRVVGFRVAYVFAVEDTDGPPIGLPRPVPESDDSFESAQLAQRLQATAAALGIPVNMRCSDPTLGTGTDGKPAGWADLERREIVVNGDLPAAARCKTLAHEIAHLVADHRANDDDRRDAEAVAEGAAFVVAAHFDLDTTAYSAPYIAGWAQDNGRVRHLLDRIGKVAAEIIDAADAIDGCPHCGWDGIADGGCIHCR